MLTDWDSKPHIIATRGADDAFNWQLELGRNPEWRELLIAELGGRAIGFVQIIDPALEETRYWGDVEQDLRAIDIWIGEENDLGRGFGTEIMQLALTRCFLDARVTGVLVDPLASNVRAHGFYERCGFRFVERRRFGQDDCFVYRVERSSRGRQC